MSITGKSLLAGLVLFVSAAGGARGQALMLEMSGPVPGSAFGNSVAVVGDLDGDGRSELAVGAPLESTGLESAGDDGASGAVRVLSGASGEVLFGYEGSGPSELLGWSVAPAGDVDGDGVPDVAVGAPNFSASRGRVLVLSGTGEEVLLEVWGADPGDRFGWAVAPMGDVDGDGHDDLAVGAFNHGDQFLGEGSVRIVSGATGGALLELPGDAAFDHFGASVAAPGDVDLDGVVDVLVGAVLVDGQQEDSGAASLRSGATGTELWLVEGKVFADLFGHAVAGAGDVTGDGVPDALVSAPASDVAGFDAGIAHLVSGATGLIERDFKPTTYFVHFGWSLCAAGDADEDGVLDVAGGAPFYVHPLSTGPGRVSVFSGSDGTLVETYDGVTALGGFGTALASGDLDADGSVDLVVGAPNEGADPVGPGVADVYSGDVWVDLGTGTPGGTGTPAFVVDGEPVVGEDVTFTVAGSAPGASAVLIVGASSLLAGFKGGTMVPHPDWFSPLVEVGGGGEAALSGSWPPGAPSGMQFYFQWWVADAGAPKGWASTEGLKVEMP